MSGSFVPRLQFLRPQGSFSSSLPTSLLRRTFQTSSQSQARSTSQRFQTVFSSNSRSTAGRGVPPSSRRNISSAPKYPFLERQANRPLPSIPPSPFRVWGRTVPLFAVAVIISTVAIFNYQKSSSSVVASILYALRRNDAVREALGDEIYFASRVPWISGEMNQLQGRINISFWVKGTKSKGKIVYHCERRGGWSGVFEAIEWTLETEDGHIIPLLDEASVQPSPV